MLYKLSICFSFNNQKVRKLTSFLTFCNTFAAKN